MKKILVVDDSFFVRRILKETIQKDTELTVAETAQNGEEALRHLKEIDVDLITLDVEMPEMDGLQTLRKIRQKQIQTPVLMVSSMTTEQARVTTRALELGAVDVVPKPSQSGSSTSGLDKIGEELISKIKAILHSSPDSEDPNQAEQNTETAENQTDGDSFREKLRTLRPEVLLIGGSTGAPPVLRSIIQDLPSDFPLPVVIVQHISEPFLSALCDNFQKLTELNVVQVDSAHPLEPGMVFLPSDQKHLVFRESKHGYVLRSRDGEPVCAAKPSVDVLFESGREQFDENMIAVLLTGMGKDGARQITKIREAGGLTLGQDRESSAVYGMPGEAAALGGLDLQAPAERIPQIIRDWTQKSLEI